MRNVYWLSLVSSILLLSTPGWAGESSRDSGRNAGRGPASIQEMGAATRMSQQKRDSDLGRIYEALIRDSKKQMTPSSAGTSFASQRLNSFNRSPASVSEPSLLTVRGNAHYQLVNGGNHAAMPWAIGTLSGAMFTVK